MGPGDRVVVTEMEHHSNLVPWQHARAAPRARRSRSSASTTRAGCDLDELDALLAGGDVKLVAVAHVSNVARARSTRSPRSSRRAHAAGALVVVDGAQAVPQIPVDLGALGADFYAWTGHKAYGPTGIGVLHGRAELLEAMPPFLGGGHMIASVSIEETRWAQSCRRSSRPARSPIAEAIGLGAAVDFLQGIGMEHVRAHERELAAYALERLRAVPGPDASTARSTPTSAARSSPSRWTASTRTTSPRSSAATGVCVRAGHHCAQPLMRRLGVGATTRASFAVHNTARTSTP